jgi:hypothetical protein
MKNLFQETIIQREKKPLPCFSWFLAATSLPSQGCIAFAFASHQLMPSIGDVPVCAPLPLIAPARPVKKKKKILSSTKTPLKKIIDDNGKIPFLHLLSHLQRM